MGRTEDVHSGRSYKSGQEREGEGGRAKGREDASGYTNLSQTGSQSCSCYMQYLKVNGMASKRLSTSLKKAREVFIFRPYCLEGSRL